MKKYLWISMAALIVLIPALIAVDLLVVNIPTAVMLLIFALLVAANVLYIVRTDAKRWKKITLPVVSALFVVLGLFGVYCNPYWNSCLLSPSDGTEDYDTVLTLKEAQQDMEQMLAVLRTRHPAFRTEIPAEFAAAYDSSMETLTGDDEITVNDLYRQMQRALSSLSDGHTHVGPQYAQPRYLKTIAARKAEGWELDAVNGMTIKEIFEASRDLFSFEADSWGIEMLSQHLTSDWGYDFLGFDLEGIEITWKNEAGERVTDVHTSADFLTFDEYQEYNAQYTSDDTGTPESFVYYDIDSENNLALLTLTQCVINDEYRACLRDFFTEVQTQGITNVAVDIRGNGGGNSMVINEFIRYLDVDSYKVDTFRHRLGFIEYTWDNAVVENDRYTDLTFTGDVYLLTDSASFSSAMLFAAYIKDNDLGTIIGEPPGNDPNGYGDISLFRMDNSGLKMSVSTKQFYRPDRECTDQLVMPDIECEGGKAMDVLLETVSAQ